MHRWKDHMSYEHASSFLSFPLVDANDFVSILATRKVFNYTRNSKVPDQTRSQVFSHHFLKNSIFVSFVVLIVLVSVTFGKCCS